MSGEWYGKTGHEIAAAIRAGEVSCREVTDSVLDRIDAVDGKVKAYVEVWHEAARQRADSLDARRAQGEDLGPLGGVPIGIKDVICTREGTTTCCSKMLKGYRSPFDATCIEQLVRAGAVFLGKLNMDEFAMGSSTENSAIHTSCNRWNLKCVPGGSSGGSAAAVAADACAWSLGSDTGGSIRQPAALCGCVGMKPTYGRVSRWGLVAFASSLDQIGPFTKDVQDMAIALNVICGHDHRDSTSAPLEVPDFTKALNQDIRGMRLGLPKEYFAEGLGAEVREKIEAALKTLEGQGAKLVEVSMPRMDYGLAAYYIISPAEASANLARFDGVRYGHRSAEARSTRDLYVKSKSEGFGREVKRRIMLGTYVLSSGYYDAYYAKAQKVRELIRQDFDRALEECDVLVTPTTPSPAFEAGTKSNDPLAMYLEDVYTVSLNLYGGPGLSIPCGLSSAGLPIGLQIMGKLFDEATVLKAAHAYERARGFDIGRPPLN